jgi:hypothetical protein
MMFYLFEARAQTKPPQPAPPTAPAKAPEEPAQTSSCDGREIKDDTFLELSGLRHEKKEMETALVRMRAQVRYLSEMPKPHRPDAVVHDRLVEMEEAIRSAEERMATLRKTLTQSHPDALAAESRLRNLRIERERLQENLAAYGEGKAKAAHVEESIERLNLDIVGTEAVVGAKEREIRELAARLTARQKTCLSR